MTLILMIRMMILMMRMMLWGGRKGGLIYVLRNGSTDLWRDILPNVSLVS